MRPEADAFETAVMLLYFHEIPPVPKEGRASVDCHHCVHSRSVAGNAHLLCTRPCAEITGNPYGIQKGWFNFPMLFDPTWHSSECPRFQAVPLTVDPAVSRAVSPTAQ